MPFEDGLSHKTFAAAFYHFEAIVDADTGATTWSDAPEVLALPLVRRCGPIVGVQGIGCGMWGGVAHRVMGWGVWDRLGLGMWVSGTRIQGLRGWSFRVQGRTVHV
jgi:hypothetical protein